MSKETVYIVKTMAASTVVMLTAAFGIWFFIDGRFANATTITKEIKRVESEAAQKRGAIEQNNQKRMDEVIGAIQQLAITSEKASIDTRLDGLIYQRDQLLRTPRRSVDQEEKLRALQRNIDRLELRRQVLERK